MDPDRRKRRLTRQQSVTGKNIRPCDDFKANLYRPDKCLNCFFSAKEHASPSQQSSEVNPFELQRLQDLLESGMIQEAEFQRRKAMAVGQAQPSEEPTDSLALRSTSQPPSVTVTDAQASSSSSGESIKPTTAPEMDEAAAEEAEDVLSAIIVVFFADGTPRYNDMTSYAVRTFIDATPRIMVGLLAPDEGTIESIVSTLAPSQRHRVLPKATRSTPYFEKWNPTQYKLDIAQYADAFETIFWFDSDTITFGDMTAFLTTFAVSNAKFYLTPDHVNSDPEFCRTWSEKVGASCVIPQACLMGFKSDTITHFFTFWEAIWMHWITPKPFVNFPDPNPTFEGSEFCIEQYALGQALAYQPEWTQSIMWFSRKSIAVPRNGNTPIDTSPTRMTSATPLLMLVENSKHPDNLINIKELRSVRLPPKTKQRLSNSILINEHFDYIDRFANLYHCYNHSYLRVRDWYQQFVLYGSSNVSSSSSSP